MRKNKWLLMPIDLLILISPWAVGKLIVSSLDGDVAQGAGIGIFLPLMALTPIMFIFGLIVTIATIHSRRAFTYSVLSFAIPAGTYIAAILFVQFMN